MNRFKLLLWLVNGLRRLLAEVKVMKYQRVLLHFWINFYQTAEIPIISAIICFLIFAIMEKCDPYQFKYENYFNGH